MQTHFLKSLQLEALAPLNSACGGLFNGVNIKPERALTLVELLVAGVIVGVVFLGIITMFIAGQKSFTNTAAQAVNQHKVNLAMEYIVEGVREVSRSRPKGRGIDISATFGASPSDGDIASSGLFTDYIDLDENGLDKDDKRYRYWLDGTDIKKSTQIYSGGWSTSWSDQIIVPQINSLEFKYCTDSSGQCKTPDAGIQITIIPAADNETYTFKIPYHY